MGNRTSVTELVEEILPTPLQAILAFLTALIWIGIIQFQPLTRHFGAGEVLPPDATKQVNLQVTHILGLSIVGQAAIIAFWSVVGLAAYLIVWWLNNAIIGARNEVIITTSYTNQKGAMRIIGTLTKLVTVGILVALLIGSVATIPYGLNIWLRLWTELLSAPFGLRGVALALGGVAGFATELYISFVLFQFTAQRFRS